MGAYENPQIIAQPDYGAIFRNNMQASYEQTNAIFERAKARRDKMEAEADQRLANVLAFDQKIGEVGGGDLEKSLQRTGMVLKDEYVNLIRNKKNMPREDYDNGIISVMRKLDELKGVGAILTQQSKELEESDISEFQEGGDNYHTLLSKWKNQEIKFQYVGDELEIYFNDSEGNKRIVDITALKDEKFMNLNEKYNLTTTQMKNLVSGVQVIDTYIDRKTGNKTQGYAGGLNEQQIIDNTANSDQMKEHFDEVEDAGSIFKDNVFKKTDAATLSSLADKISLNNNLTAEQKAEFKKLITSGSYDDIKLKGEDGIEISYRSLVDQVSRQKLATEAFQQYAPKLGKVTFTGEASGDSDDSNKDYVTGLNNALNKLQKTDFKNYTQKEDEGNFFSENFLNYIETIPGLAVDRKEFDDGRVLISPTQFAKKLGKEISITPRMTEEEIKRTISIALGVPDNIIEQTNFSKDIENGKLMQGIRDEQVRIGMEPIVYNGINISQ